MGVCDEETAACKQDRKDYDDAKFNRGTAEGEINAANSDRTAALAIIAGGLTVTAGGAAIGWTGVGIAVGLFGFAGTCVGSYRLGKADEQLANARRACQDARKRMKDAYDASLNDCKNAECRPSSDIPACP
jgi:hypothetical protein